MGTSPDRRMHDPRASAPRGVWRRALAVVAFIGAASAASAQPTGTATATAAATPRVAGTIELAAGDAMIEGRDGKTRLPKVGDAVAEGETVVTFARAELQLHMEDGAYLSVRENSRLKIAAYVADGGKDDRSVLELLQGSLRSVTGWIGKFNRSAYQVRTPTATIGVRGTDHEPTYIPVGDPRGEPGAYDKVNEGRTFLQSGSHSVEVGANQAAFHPHSGAARPRLLPSIPAFFKPAPNEQRFVERSREVRATVDKRRLERQETVRRAPPGRGEGPSKAAPPAPRPGVQSRAVEPGAGASPQKPGPAAGSGGPAAKHGDLKRQPASGAPPTKRPAEPHSAPGANDRPKRQIERDPARSERATTKGQEDSGERRGPRGGAGQHR